MFDRTNRTLICSVVFLDIVEYTRQPVTAQARLKERFNAALSAALQDIAVNDRIILDTGDGAAISFLGDPEDALFVTMTLRDHCEAATDPAMRISLRIGINLGPVKLVKDINGRPNLIGDGINVAQRIMSFAEPGVVMVSRSYYEVVSCLSEEYAKLFQYIGSRTDKHVRDHEVYTVGFSEQMRRARPPRRRNFPRLQDVPQMRTITPRRWVKPAVLGGSLAFLVFAVASFLFWHASHADAASPAIAATPNRSGMTLVKQTTTQPTTPPAEATPTSAIAGHALAPIPAATPMPAHHDTALPMSAPAVVPASTAANTARAATAPSTQAPQTDARSTVVALGKPAKPAKRAQLPPPASVNKAEEPSQPKPAESRACAPGECWASERR